MHHIFCLTEDVFLIYKPIILQLNVKKITDFNAILPYYIPIFIEKIFAW
ncbi:hypothetical protein CRENPOLYSF1_100072 [Crenothrix polyspora]|uniref:Uncharacterized protein n=1 Tax=Crenothrix polyspora TaxID=360316 RepID=A0A1R4H045_9GAMM|nr:hypothetical protein CRENPOLYSF1_100072 [Crenothrix polyspora]